MSGHSKWSQIKHKKGASDQKRGQLFSKLVKGITIAARDGADPRLNLKLKNAMDQAHEMNMPNENIERAIKKAAERDAAQLVEFQLELLGPAGVAVIVTGITDNKNRTLGELKTMAARSNLKAAGENSLVWMFKKIEGDFVAQEHCLIELNSTDRGTLEKALTEIDNHDDVQNIFTNLKEI